MLLSDKNLRSVTKVYADAGEVQNVRCGPYELAVRTWGDDTLPPLLCMHGLGGQGLNFAALAKQLVRTHRIIAPDMIGRGGSPWASDPEVEYRFEIYEAVICDLLAHFEVERLSWLGVSMGGALGIRMAGGALKHQVERLVLNDVGPSLDPAVAQRIREAMQAPSQFHSLKALADYFANAFGQFGMVPPVGMSWYSIAQLASVQLPDGSWRLHFDPNVAQQLRHHSDDYDNADAFAEIECPLLVFRGAQSEVLCRKSLTRMRNLQPSLRAIEVPDVGHTPFLDRDSDLAVLRDFLQADHIS